MLRRDPLPRRLEPRRRAMADANLVAFELDRYDAILVNHGGCGAMLKEYGLHWHDGLQPHRAKFAEKIKDVHEFLDALGLVPPSGRIAAAAVYHDACHLAHAQGVTAAPRRLLAKIPGLELRDLPETGLCCGSAGTYNLNEPAMSDRLAARKMDNILGTGAENRSGRQRRLSASASPRGAAAAASVARHAPYGPARFELSGADAGGVERAARIRSPSPSGRGSG